MSSNIFSPNDPFLASCMRVLRGKDSLQQLVDLLPSLEQKALSSPSTTLTDYERRQLLDLPNAEDEAEYIGQVSSRSREELISTMLSDPQTLSDDEIKLLKRFFWSELSREEESKSFDGAFSGNEEVMNRIFRARELASVDNEFIRAPHVESSRRDKQRQDTKQRNFGRLSNIPAWMQDLYQQLEEQREDLKSWGFFAFYDAEAQAMGPELLESFEETIGGTLRKMMQYNGVYQSLLNRKWNLVIISAPPDAYASIEPSASIEQNADNAKLRNVFWDFLDENKEYGAAQLPNHPSARELLNDPSSRGILTNTFLVINQACVESITTQPFLDDIRILAFEAKPPDKTSIEGYPGWTWVRLEQIIDNFYYERMNNTPMDVIWKAAQESKNQAFTSLDPEEAKVWSNSTILSGPQPGSIMGRRMRVAQ